MFKLPKLPTFEWPKKSFRELVNAKIPLDKTPAADVLAFQAERNVEQAKKENPQANSLDVSVTAASRMLALSTYSRLSCGTAENGPKDFEREEKLSDIKPIADEIFSGIKRAKLEVLKDHSNDGHVQNWYFYINRNPHYFDIKYRIYLTFKPEKIGEIFTEIIRSVPPDINFQMKMLDSDNPYDRLARNDKIIIYGTEKDIDKLFEVVREVYGRHKQAFAGRKFPPGGKPTEMEGVSVAHEIDNPDGTATSATLLISHEINENIGIFSYNFINPRLMKFEDNPALASSSEIGKTLFFAMEKITEQYHWCIRNNGVVIISLSDDIQKKLSRVYAEVLYRITVYRFTNGERVTDEEIYQFFLRSIKLLNLPRQYLDHFSKIKVIQDIIKEGDDFDTAMDKGLKVASLAMVLNEGVKKGQSAGEAFRTILKE